MIEILRGGFAVAFLLSFAIFIHELGHFFFAKLFGVKVETFSIGFGKKIFRVKRGDTDYCISAIPLGGYVKMVGMHSEEMDKILTGEKPASAAEEADAELAAAELDAPAPASLGRSVIEEVDALRSKPYWQKFLVFSAGCINNFLTALCVFFLMNWIGYYWEEPTPAVIDAIENVEPQKAGVQAGDRVVAINGKPVEDYDDLLIEYDAAADKQPGHGSISAQVIGEQPGSTTRTVVIPMVPPTDPALPSGTIVSVNNTPVKSADAAAVAVKKLLQLEKNDPIPVTVRTASGDVTTTVPPIAAAGKSWPLLSWAPRQPAYVLQPIPNLPAEKAGMKVGDEIVNVAGVPVRSAVASTHEIRKHLGETIPIEVLRGKKHDSRERVTLKVEVRPHPDNPKLGQIGIAYGAGPHTHFIKYPVGHSFKRAWTQGIGILITYVHGVGDLLKSSFQSLRENVGGPIAIGTQAYKAANEGWPYFFWLFATFNIILAFTNLLPLPILDGGHILFSTIEAIIRRPLPAKFMLVIYNVFTFLIIGLALVITFNDVVMNWWRLR
jgi:regulator of sigma E protease